MSNGGRYALEQHEENNRQRIEEAFWDMYDKEILEWAWEHCREQVLDTLKSEYWELVDHDLREAKT